MMDKIQTGSVKMLPKWYFVAGSLLTLIGLVSTFIISVFLITIIRFSLKTHGPMGEYRWNEIVSSFPWWAVALAIIGIICGFFLLRKYEFSYKRNYWLIILGFTVAVVITGITIDYLDYDAILFRQGPMRGIMRQFIMK